MTVGRVVQKLQATIPKAIRLICSGVCDEISSGCLSEHEIRRSRVSSTVKERGGMGRGGYANENRTPSLAADGYVTIVLFYSNAKRTRIIIIIKRCVRYNIVYRNIAIYNNTVTIIIIRGAAGAAGVFISREARPDGLT